MMKKILIGIAGLAAITLSVDAASAQTTGWRTRPYHNYETGDWFFDRYGDRENFQAGYMTRGEVYGRVLAIKKVAVHNSRFPHLVALIRTYDDRNITVDLGPARKARRLGLRSYGDRLWVTGEHVRIRGRDLILARTARTEHRRIAINGADRRWDMRYRPRQEAGRYRYDYRY